MAVAVAAPRRPTGEESDPQDPLAGHPLAEELRAGPHRGFTTEVRRLVLVRGAATAAGATLWMRYESERLSQAQFAWMTV